MHPLAERLGKGFISNFYSADHEMTWTAAEAEHMLALTPNIILVGRVDAEGVNAVNNPFFAEWKTMNGYKARNMEAVKRGWRMDPQALTYGVLLPEVKDFTVRWAVKPIKPDGPVTFDFEWYTYTQAEVDWWRSELIAIGNDILERRKTGVFRKNISNCMKYGEKYACPLFAAGCSQLNFDFVPTHMLARTPHLAIERKLIEEGNGADVVILDASRTDIWLECEHKYHRFYEGAGLTDEGEALTIGIDFHAIIASNIKSLIKENNPCSTSQ